MINFKAATMEFFQPIIIAESENIYENAVLQRGRSNLKGAAPVQIPRIQVVHGELLVDGVQTPSYYHQGNFYWERTRPDGEQENGMVSLRQNGLSLQGMVCAAGEQKTFTAVSNIRYYMEYQTVVAEPAESFYLLVGTEMGEDGAVETFARIEDMSQELYESCYYVDEKGYLHVTITFAPELQAFCPDSSMGKLEHLDLCFSLDYRYGQGELWIKNQEGKVEKIIPISAVLADNQADIDKPRLRSARRVLATLPNRKELRAAALQAEQQCNLNINDLYTLNAPEMKKVSETARDKLFYLMILHASSLEYVHPQDNKQKIHWSDYFNVTCEEALDQCSKPIQELLKDKEVTDFLEKYALALLALIFDSGTGKIKERVNRISNLKNKVEHYMKSSDTSGMLSDPGYLKAMKVINQETYIQYSPRIAAYRDSDQRKEWAEKLYRRSIKNIRSLRYQKLNQENTRANHLRTILQILDEETYIELPGQSLSYGDHLQEQILNVFLKDVLDQVNFTDEESFKKLLCGGMSHVLQHYQELDWLSDQIKTDLESDLLAGADSDETAGSVIDNVNAAVEIIASVVYNQLATGKLLIQSIYEGARCLGKTQISTIVIPTLIIFALGICQFAFGLKEFAKMSDAEKVETVLVFTGCICNSWNIGQQMADLYLFFRDGITDMQRLNAALRLKFSGMNMDVLETLTQGKRGFKFMDTLKSIQGRYSLGNIQTIAQAQDISVWTKITRISATVIRLLNLAILAVTIAVLGYEIVDEKKRGMPDYLYALDATVLAITGCLLVIEVIISVAEAIGIASSLVCTVLPFVALVIGVLGFIVGVVSAILHSNFPTVTEKFIDDKIKPFVEGLPDPEAA